MKKIARLLGRGVVVILAAGFAYLAYIYLTLPDVRPLRTQNPSTTAFMELRARDAQTAAKPFTKDQRWMPYGRISQHLKRAVIVTEDASFWQHGGIDYDQLRESMEVNWERGEFARGASTITQQLAKNLYLSPSKNPVRKVKELLITRRLEAELTKQRILELYLNEIEWGDGIWGAEAAAHRYFHKSASELTAQESALLAAAIANPHIMNPAHPTARLRRREEMIMRRMGAVTPPPALVEPPPLIQPVEGIPVLPPAPDLTAPSGTGRGGGPGQ